MPRKKENPESRERAVLVASIDRLHGTIDRIRNHDVIQREGLDFECDRMLDLCDEIKERIPEVMKVAA